MGNAGSEPLNPLLTPLSLPPFTPHTPPPSVPLTIVTTHIHTYLHVYTTGAAGMGHPGGEPLDPDGHPSQGQTVRSWVALMLCVCVCWGSGGCLGCRQTQRDWLTGMSSSPPSSCLACVSPRHLLTPHHTNRHTPPFPPFLSNSPPHSISSPPPNPPPPTPTPSHTHTATASSGTSAPWSAPSCSAAWPFCLSWPSTSSRSVLPWHRCVGI